jgi:multiple sugar transport system permease protein
MIRQRTAAGVKIILLLLIAIWTVVPILLVVMNSFKNQMDIFTVPPKLTFVPTMENYSKAVSSGDFGSYFKNSTVVAVISSMLSVGLGTLAAYGLTGFRLKWANAIANGFLLGKLVPAITMLLPLFVLIKLAGLLGTYVGPIVAHTAVNLPFVIWLIIGFMRDVPQELEASSVIDGCSKMQTFWKIIVPIILPGIAAATILAMQFSWNELVFSMQLTGMSTYTLPVGISRLVGSISVDWGKSSAGATITMVPMIIIGFFVQKYIAQGTTSGSVKG